MNFVNDYFTRDLLVLPKTYGCLNSFFETRNDSILWFGVEPQIAIKEVFVVHFTAKGKPWMYRDKPHWMNSSTKEFYRIHQMWHDFKGKVC